MRSQQKLSKKKIGVYKGKMSISQNSKDIWLGESTDTFIFSSPIPF